MSTEQTNAYVLIKLEYSSYFAVPLEKFAELVSCMKVVKEEYKNGRNEMIVSKLPMDMKVLSADAMKAIEVRTKLLEKADAEELAEAA